MARRPLCVLCLLLMTVMCAADWLGAPLIRGNPLPVPLQTWVSEHPDATICGEVERCADTEFSQSIYLKETYLIYKSEKVSLKNVRVFLKKKQEVPAGAVLLLSGKLEEVEGPRNPGEFDSRQYYACSNIFYFLKKAEILKQSQNYSRYGQFLLDLQNRFADVLSRAAGPDAPVFSAIVLGDKSSLDIETKMRYQMAGIIHMLAISGLHISVLGMGLYQLLKKLGLGIWPAGLLALAVMLQYGMMTGASVSTMRAVCMFLLSVGAKILGRIYDMMTALAIAAILILADCPAYLYSSSFLLSFGAVLGIGVVSPLLIKLMGTEKKLIKALLGSLSVQITTLPVMLWFYGEVSVAGVFLNLVVLPTVGVVLASGVAAVLLGCAWTGAGIACALPGRGLLFLYEHLCILAAKLPFCTWIGGQPTLWQAAVYYVLLGLGLWLADRVWMAHKAGGVRAANVAGEVRMANVASGARIAHEAGRVQMAHRTHRVRGKKEGESCALCREIVILTTMAGVLLLGYHSHGELKITCLDVGQGDGIVLETPQGGHFLIDGGSSNKSALAQYQLLPYLKSQGISFLDAILISHTDDDHISGVKELLGFMADGLTTIRVGYLLLPGWIEQPEAWQELASLAKKAGVRVKSANAGDALRSGAVRLTLLAPEEGRTGSDVNEDGMVVLVEYDRFKGLFTGDVGEESEKALLDKLEDVDFLKVGHHGSKNSSFEDFLNKIRPEISVISCSATNTYGHPSPDAVKRLEDIGSRVEYTMKSGAVSVVSDGEHMWVERFLTLG
ncbi:DNA internalization-related competence protein ComEC/Rec2 [Blautia schinkii]|nr:DNA internalization-related competence protein ComEC/Rec2 [Blautia schinkii]